MAYFPMFIDIEKKKCLVAGGGTVALRKVRVLLDFGAQVMVVAPQIDSQILRLTGNVCVKERTFEPEDLKECVLVVAATDDAAENHRIAQLARENNIPVNAVDQQEDCSFIFPSYLKHQDLVGAFSSAGNSPVLTQYLKEALKDILTEELGQINGYMGSKNADRNRKTAQTGIPERSCKITGGGKNFACTGGTGTDSYTGKAYERVKEKRNKGMDRTRRLRQTAVMRSMVRENHVRTEELIYPLFVMEGENIVQPVESMPGICQYSVDRMNEELDRVKALQIPAILIFGIPEHKDEVGSGAYDEHGIVQTAIRRIKKDYPDLLVIADVCLCEYTSHGHCGLIRDGIILNDETLPLLAQTAVSYARAGADIIAPSDMMDKRVGAIRQALDAAGFTYTPIMAYSAKFASGYYGPFRDAAHSAPGFGDRKTYQMDPANGREAMREVEEDIAEGADLIIAKPAMAYMDIITEIRRNYNIPIVAYNVSGEYSMVKAAAANGWIDEKKIVMENLIGMKRAGADMIITYHALDVAEWIQKGEV